MSKKKPIVVEMKIGCLGDIMRFFQLQMPPKEILALATHVESCFDCREYINTLSTLLRRREEILKQLEKGGFHER